MNATVTPITSPKSNAPSFDSLRQMAKTLGEEFGRGKDTQIKFAMALIEGAYLGALSTHPDKHGVGISDAIVLTKEYFAARNASVIFDVKAPNIKKAVSNSLKCIKAGSSPKWGRGQPWQSVQDFMMHYTNMRKVPGNVKKMDDACNALLRMLTAQLKSPTLLPDSERNAFVFKNDPGIKTVVEELEAVRKRLIRLGEGRLSGVDGADTSVEVKSAVNSITTRLTAIAKGAK